jgi:hypothetical protein
VSDETIHGILRPNVSMKKVKKTTEPAALISP